MSLMRSLHVQLGESVAYFPRKDMGSRVLEKLSFPFLPSWTSCRQPWPRNEAMPEMPEIETIARKLRETIIGKRIQRVRLSGLPLRRPVAATFPAQVEGRRIRRIHRRGKYLVLELEPLSYCLIHLGMSGRIVVDGSGSQMEKHTQAVLCLSDGTELRYMDHRRFGLLAGYEVGRLSEIPEVEALGIDPLSARFREDRLWSEVRKSRQQIKSLLLDQQKIAGLGNIYADESLWVARIHPARRANTLAPCEAGGLHTAIVRVVADEDPAGKSELRQRLEASRAHVELEFPYFIEKQAPVSRSRGLMEYQCRMCGTLGASADFVLVVTVPVTSLCPCSKEISACAAHNQRSAMNVHVRYNGHIWLEDLIDWVEACASAPVYSLLKREDEKAVTEQAYDHPMFVEDMVRAVTEKLAAVQEIVWLRVECENFESIHNHSAYALVEWQRP